MSLSLKQLQQAFMAELSGKANEDFRSLVVDNTLQGRMGKDRRVEIYRLNHVGARAKGLENTYPVCRQILGEQAFDRLANGHVGTCPSNHWDLNFHGEDFGRCLADKCDQIAALSDFFYIGELAKLEWLYHICYYADDTPPPVLHDQAPEKALFSAR